MNTVKRAMSIYDAIKQKKPKAIIALLHSRFRPDDRQKALEKVLADPDKNGSICISTQVVEVGVDISATTLITDLAPGHHLYNVSGGAIVTVLKTTIPPSHLIVFIFARFHLLILSSPKDYIYYKDPCTKILQ